MVVPSEDFAQLQLQIVDQTQWRYEVIRPIVLFVDRTPRQRTDETETHPSTVRTLTRRFQQQGMAGLLPEDVEVIVRARAPRVAESASGRRGVSHLELAGALRCLGAYGWAHHGAQPARV